MNNKQAQKIFNISNAEYYKMRWDFLDTKFKEKNKKEKTTTKKLQKILSEKKSNNNYWLNKYINARKQDEWFIKWQLDENEKEIEKIKKKIYFKKALNKNKRLIAQKMKKEKNLTKDEVIKKYKIKTIDIEEIKQIPIRQILNNYGIKISSTNFFKLRDEKTASVKLYEDTNSYYDYGPGQGGSVIDLIMFLEKITIAEAINILKELI